MELIADILLVAGALGAGLYCFVLSRRLKRFTDLEQGVGGAVAVLSTQAEELKKSLDSARAASDESGNELKELTERAQSVAQRLELMMASMHDVIPEEKAAPEPPMLDVSDVQSEPNEETEEGSEAEETSDAQESDEDNTPSEDNSPEQPTKAPEGLMFFRHKRQGVEAAE
ncbi:hypothetical protein [Ruegeria sp.]|uniref:hypothetical protein n=1 Tax=Ruegeria sp. TaxID=1879320 RepID=UPI003AFF64B8